MGSISSDDASTSTKTDASGLAGDLAKILKAMTQSIVDGLRIRLPVNITENAGREGLKSKAFNECLGVRNVFPTAA